MSKIRAIIKRPDEPEMIGQRIRQRLDELHMTQRELAEMIDTTEVSISRYVCDTRMPSADRLWKIAKALNVPMEYFFED